MNSNKTFYILLLFLIFINFNCKTTQTKSNNTNTMDPNVNYKKLGISAESLENLKPLPNGTPAPNFKAKDQNGELIELSNLTEKGPVVLVFYRGYWCPICDRHLSEFAGRLSEVKAKGATVLAIAPEGPDYRDKMNKDTGLDVPFISDNKHVIMDQYGVTFKVTDGYNTKITVWKGTSIEDYNADDEPYLPIPATYIIGTDGKIKWSHYDPDYRNRASVDDILKQL